VQGLQFVRVRGDLRPVEQLERYLGAGHDHPGTAEEALATVRLHCCEPEVEELRGMGKQRTLMRARSAWTGN
jgi:hypothetical protein